MNRPEDFEKNEDRTAEAQENQEAQDRFQREGAQNAQQGAQWYGISYENQGMGYAPPHMTFQGGAPARQRKGKRLALIAAILVVCMLFSAVVGFAGAFLLEELGWFVEPFEENNPLDNIEGGNTATGSDGHADAQTPVYRYTDTSYDFTAVYAELIKNRDTNLIGSEFGSASNNKMSKIQATAAVKDSVVEIATTTVSNRGTISSGAGSGVIIHEDGIIVTNNHVIENCDEIYVRLTNGDTYEAHLRGTDEDGDIAILKITPQEGKALTVAKLGYSGALAVGEEVIAIGNPLGQLGGTATYGNISALDREVQVEGVVMTLIQTDAAINSGNSGGGLFNMAGELIGVVNAKYSAEGVEGLGFAIPIDAAYEDSFADLLNYGYIRGIPSLGVSLVERTGINNVMNTIYGSYVYSVGSQSDFRVGDYIYSIDGTQVYGITSSSNAAIKSIVRSHAIGESVKVVVIRSNSYETFYVTLQEYVPAGGSLTVEN